MKLLTIDLETHDPYIDRDLGAGWVFKLNNIPGNDFEFLGAAYRTHEGEIGYETDIERVRALVDSHDGLIAHNASYDIGSLMAFGIDSVKDKLVFDTEVGSRLFNSGLQSHSLDNVAQLYLKTRKNNMVLADAVWDHDLYPWLKKEEKARDKAEKLGEPFERAHPGYSKLLAFAKKNMKLIQQVAPKAMARYAMDDVIPTFKLFEHFSQHIDMELFKKYSMLCHICIDYRRRGVRVDLDQARAVSDKLRPIIAQKFQECYDIAGMEFNLNSPKDVPFILAKLGLTFPKTSQGNPSITSPWLAQQEHPICKAIVEARKAKKIHKDFVEKIIEMQEFTSPQSLPDNQYGRVFPELNLMRARTGRFSCSCPNLQQIPSRDPVYGPLCRSIFVPEEGEKWFSLDFSNQEGRLQVHYASILKCEGADALVQEFTADPNLDMHQKVADLAGISRTEAKAINLGLSYGMGISKLAKSLGLSENQAKLLRDKYNTLAPFLDQLKSKCETAMKKRGYIKTLGGRHSATDPPMVVDGQYKTFEYKALNKLIQGSAADQTIECMIQAYAKGIPVLFPVHDSMELSGNKEQATELAKIMENAVDLRVPVVVDYSTEGGDSWAGAKSD